MRQFGNEAEHNMTVATDASGNRRRCRQRCEIQSQEMISTTSAFPNVHTMRYREDYCFTVQKIYR